MSTGVATPFTFGTLLVALSPGSLVVYWPSRRGRRGRRFDCTSPDDLAEQLRSWSRARARADSTAASALLLADLVEERPRWQVRNRRVVADRIAEL